MENVYTIKSYISYCDAIAHTIKAALQQESTYKNTVIMGAGSVRSDLDEGGALVSTTKKINAVDINGKLYEITIQEA